MLYAEKQVAIGGEGPIFRGDGVFKFVGDGAKQEREAVDDICRAHEVRLEKLVLHDYGYSAKAGEAIVDCSEDVLESLHDETLEKTGADVTFVRKRK